MRNLSKVKKIDKKIKVFIPLEKTTDFSRWSLPYKADGGLIPPSAQTVKEQGSLTGFISRRSNILRSFFVCLFLVLLYIQQSTAQVDPVRSNPARQDAPPSAGTSNGVDPKLTAKIKTALISKPWPIYVTYQQMVKGTVKSSVEEDLLTFTEGAVLSSSLSAQGYSKDGSSYKVKIAPAGDTYIWESIMLHKNQKDIVMLKGELKNGVMTGVIIYQPQDRPAKTCNFTTIPQE
jgi:hypothetical protein